MPSFCKSCVVLEKVCVHGPGIRFGIPAGLGIAIVGSAGFAFPALGEICREDVMV